MVSAEGNKGVQMPSLGLSKPRARSQVSDASGGLLVSLTLSVEAWKSSPEDGLADGWWLVGGWVDGWVAGWPGG